MKIGFIGAGKVGFSLGKVFSEGGLQVIGYYSRHKESAEAAAKFTESKCYDDPGRLVADCDAVFLTVPDGVITEIFEKLKDYDLKGRQICHCSGSMTAQKAFPGIGQTGAEGYSIHPLFPVSDRFASYRELKDAFFCIEGCEAHLNEWKERLEALGPQVQIIPSGRKVLYHAACAIACNLPLHWCVTLATAVVIPACICSFGGPRHYREMMSAPCTATSTRSRQSRTGSFTARFRKSCLRQRSKSIRTQITQR